MHARLVAILAYTLVSTQVASRQNWTHCSPVCECDRSQAELQAQCSVGALLMQGTLKLPPNVQTLSLRSNGIQTILSGTFRGLPQLTHLDLRDNKLQEWKVDLAFELEALEVVQLSGNKDFTPDQSIFRLCKLNQIQGVSWSMHCRNCTLAKPKDTSGSYNKTAVHGGNTSDVDNTCVLDEDEFIHSDDVTYGKGLEFIKLGFTPQCLCTAGNMECYQNEIQYPYFRELYSVPRKLFYVQYGLGVAILVLNMVIVVFILVSRLLRNSTSFILICSMACSDILIGVYTIEIAMFNPFKNSSVTPSELPKNDIKMCPYIGVVFTTGQATTVFTSFFLTTERYLAIVHCDNPDSRLSTRVSLLISAVVWVLSFTFALLPILGVPELQYHKWFQCTMPFHKDSNIEDTSSITFAVAVIFVLVYLISIGMYIRIYVFVRKASSHLGVKREARLAKRISLVVVSNFVFFIIPMVLFLVYVYNFMELLFRVAEMSVGNMQAFIVMGSWIPVTLFGISSLINPFLYAFRHQKFKREVRKMGYRMSQSIGSFHSHGSDRKESGRYTRHDAKSNTESRVRKHKSPTTIEMQLCTEEDENHVTAPLDP